MLVRISLMKNLVITFYEYRKANVHLELACACEELLVVFTFYKKNSTYVIICYSIYIRHVHTQIFE